ncbi:MAG: c-type cytochrome [Leptospirales bacterium]
MENRFKPMDNRMAIIVTIAIAALFFVLFLFFPEPSENKKTNTPIIQGRVYSSDLSTQNLFQRACSQCHSLPPLIHRSREDWRILVLKMNRNMLQTGKRYLTPDQIEPLINYILANQKPS